MEPDRLGRRVWALFTPYRASLVAIVVAVLVSSGLGIITPFLTQAAFDRRNLRESCSRLATSTGRNRSSRAIRT